MTTPAIVQPFKYKTLIAGLGGLLTVVVPLITQLAVHLPPEWQAVIGGIIALLTMFGVYQAPYRPPNTVIVPVRSVSVDTVPPADSGYTNPWKPRA